MTTPLCSICSIAILITIHFIDGIESWSVFENGFNYSFVRLVSEREDFTCHTD